MACAGRLLLLLSLLPTSLAWRTKSVFLFHKRMGDACDDHAQCQSRCCVTNSLNPQTFCTSKTIFLKCLPWQKPNRHTCSDHAECKSRCCVTNSSRSQMFCKPKTIFLQCTPWRKPNGAYCSHHKECHSQCCLVLNELSRPCCVRRSGLLAQCLPLVSDTSVPPPSGDLLRRTVRERIAATGTVT
ncbi:leucine-rich colipase-like protein 1 [Ursus maritimus]|uniref:Leucine-rich colipase-like protein 1 n=1 Tax=Ursus maritimus TaxID=29073 RepID=A0A8M1F548_URSMA|nr:leucine-rich colipase-like protein 1 [Ursus arctos]XP_040476029.1 leucine-rich colipase-like protein 1 [Ursus maritimus]